MMTDEKTKLLVEEQITTSPETEVTKKTATTKKAPAKKAVKKAPKTKNYLNNKDFLEQVLVSKAQDEMTDELAKMFMLLADRLASKGNFAGYSYIEDMKSAGLANLCRGWKSFNEEKSNNPFAYYTQILWNSFVQVLNQEKKQRDIRDSTLLSMGMSPSHSYILEHEAKQAREQEEREAREAEENE